MTKERPQRAALVTGAARGIGEAIARMLAVEGYALTLFDRLADELDAVAASLNAAGQPAIAIQGDVRDEAAIQTCVEAHLAQWQRMDVLVNNAGVAAPTPIDSLSAKRMDLILDVNLRATILFTRESVAALKAAGAEHGGATIINLASISAKQGVANLNIYSAAKAAVVAFTQAMNQELAPFGVRSTALCPDAVDTPMTAPAHGQTAPAAMMTVEDVAEAARFLLRLSPNCVVPEIVMNMPGHTTETFEMPA